MIDLEALARRWAAAFSGQADVKGLTDDQLRLLDTGLAVRRANDVARVLVAELAMLLAEVRERRKLHDLALSDLHDLVKLALELRAYGKARIEVSEAFEAWEPTTGAKRTRTGEELNAAHRAREAAMDRIEAIAVQLAGGDVARVCGCGEEVDGG